MHTRTPIFNDISLSLFTIRMLQMPAMEIYAEYLCIARPLPSYTSILLLIHL